MFERTALFIASGGNGFFNENKPPFDQVFIMNAFKDNREVSTNQNEDIFIIYNH
jgi:hypothetical protein